MAYTDQFTLSQNAAFIGRVQVACIIAANTVLANNTPGRIDTARRILNDPAAYAVLVANGIQSDATVAASAPTGGSLTDPQLQTAVNAFLPNLLR